MMLEVEKGCKKRYNDLISFIHKIKARHFLYSTVVFIFIVLAITCVKYYNNTRYFSPVSFEIIGENGAPVKNAEIWGVSPLNKMIRLYCKWEKKKWENTYGLFKEFKLVGTPDYLDSVRAVIVYTGHDEVIDTLKINMHDTQMIECGIQQTLYFIDQSFIKKTPIEKAFLIVERIFDKLKFTFLAGLLSLVVLFVLAKTRVIDSHTELLKIIVFLCVLIQVLRTGGLVHADTGSYELTYSHRPVLYPMYLFLMTHFWNSKIPLVILNALFGFIAARLLSKKFCNTFHFGGSAEFIGFAILLIPYVNKEYLVANYMIAESLSYPLFLLFFYKILNVINTDFLKKSINGLMIVTILLVLSRGQFLFVYGIIFLMLLWLFITSHKNKFVFFLAILFSIGGYNLVDATYHYAVHGKFHTTAFGGYLLAVNAFYNSTPADSSLFKGEEKQMFKKISASIESNRLRKNFCDNMDETGKFINFLYSFDEILWRKGFTYPFNVKEKTSDNFQKNILFRELAKDSTIISLTMRILCSANSITLKQAELERLLSGKIINIKEQKKLQGFRHNSEGGTMGLINILSGNKTHSKRSYSWNEKNKLLSDIAICLTLANFPSTIETAFINLKHGCYLTGWAHIEFALCFLFLIALLICYFRFRKNNSLIISIVLLLHLANLILISLMVYMTNRYMFYTKYLLLFTIITLLSEKGFRVFKNRFVPNKKNTETCKEKVF